MDATIASLKASVADARERVKANIAARNERVVKHALEVIKTKIDELGTYARLATPELRLLLTTLGSSTDLFHVSDVPALQEHLPTGFACELIKCHYYDCDCHNEDGCTDGLRVTWSWD